MGGTKTKSGERRRSIASLQAWLGAQSTVDRWCYAVGAVLILSGVLHFGVFILDDRPWSGPVSWRKPSTFGLSFGLTLIAIMWVARYLEQSSRARTWTLGLLAADCVLEVAGITVQAWRDVPSHLNTETLLDASIAYSLAGGGALLVVLLGRLCIIALAGRVNAAPSMRLAVQAGSVLLLVGLVTGAAMIAYGRSFEEPSDAYAEAGFLKPVHGVTLHAILVLPALAWLLGQLRASEAIRTRILAVASAGYVLAAVVAFAYSLGRM